MVYPESDWDAGRVELSLLPTVQAIDSGSMSDAAPFLGAGSVNVSTATTNTVTSPVCLRTTPSHRQQGDPTMTLDYEEPSIPP